MEKKIGIIGLGYVGLPLAVEFAKKHNVVSSSSEFEFTKKYNVVGFDIDYERISELRNGHDRTGEVESSELISHSIEYSINDNILEGCDVFIVTVPTPVDTNKQPDLSPLIKASETIGKYLKDENLVIYESTVYPSCTEEVCMPILSDVSENNMVSNFYVGYSPERINPGDKINTLTSIQKVVSGNNETATKMVDELYQSIGIKTHIAPNIKVAEMSKAIENSQRDLNISFMNELAIYCSRLGIKTNDVLKAAGTKWNFLPFTAGLVGGHCIGVDPYYLIHKAEGLGLHLNVIASGRRVNDQMPKFIVSNLIKEMIRQRCDMINPRILVMGVTFKENVPDIRNSKVIDVIDELKSYKTTVDVYDPYADERLLYNEYGILSSKHIRSFKNLKFDAIIYCVDHKEFNSFDFFEYLPNNRNYVIYDLKNKLPEGLVDIYL